MKCKTCGQEFATQSDMTKHTHTAHPEKFANSKVGRPAKAPPEKTELKAEAAPAEAPNSSAIQEVDLQKEADEMRSKIEKPKEEEKKVLRCGSCHQITQSREKCDNCGVEFE